MPQPVSSRGVDPLVYDEVQGVCAEPTAGSTPSKPSNPAPPVGSGLPPPGAALLVQRHDNECRSEKVAVLQASVAVVGSAAAVALASPTGVALVPSLASFVVSAMGLGRAAANLENCERAAEERNVASGL